MSLEIVRMLVEGGMWQRRACWYLGVCRATVRYVKRSEDPVNMIIRDELKRLSVNGNLILPRSGKVKVYHPCRDMW